MKETQKTIAAVVAGTGFEGRQTVIRRHCREGSPVQLRREPRNPFDPNAIAVWIACPRLFGLITGWEQIGYIQAQRAEAMALKLDQKKIVVTRAFVRSFYAAATELHPRVSLQIEVTERA